uniref:Uncharacterized protein n=1 Tax=viral metagenome TaxID=1070528 RepID=A0A6H1ZBN9_9ZZZZ
MTISERTLRKWRGEVLRQIDDRNHGLTAAAHFQNKDELLSRVLRMTQELLDQHLLKK